MSTIAIGVVGAGLIGRKHIARILAHPDYRLVGIADVDVEATAARCPNARIFAGHRALLDEAKPDAVLIASPNAAHAEAGIDCARRGVAILVEKPVTDTLEAAAHLLAEVERTKIPTLVGHHRRHHRQVQAAKELIAEKRIGDLVGVSGIWATYKPDAYFAAGPWRRAIGGGPILINLIHEIDFLRFAVGEIAAIGAVTSNRRRGFAVEDTAAVLIEFANGALGTFLMSDSATSPWTSERGIGEAPEFPYSGESAYRFLGASGALEFPNLMLWSQAGEPNWNDPIRSERINAPTIDAYVAQLDHFRDVVRGTAASIQTVADGARTLAATLAVSEAAASRSRVVLGP